ncbi:hypothetical protein EWH91_12450 [Sporolactobacillus sp. THM19-2]|nr:hypothetical protein EWH91_12450 [Sporolactobacillus sp. THM19-2]
MDKTFRNLLNNRRINWQMFLILLCQRIIRFIEPLTNSALQNVFIVDDSMYKRYKRAHAKHLELAAFQFDHAEPRHTRGFRFLQLGWSEGNTFLPVTFSLLSGQNQICGAKADARTYSGKRKLQAQRKALKVVQELLVSALSQGSEFPTSCLTRGSQARRCFISCVSSNFIPLTWSSGPKKCITGLTAK